MDRTGGPPLSGEFIVDKRVFESDVAKDDSQRAPDVRPGFFLVELVLIRDTGTDVPGTFLELWEWNWRGRLASESWAERPCRGLLLGAGAGLAAICPACG